MRSKIRRINPENEAFRCKDSYSEKGIEMLDGNDNEGNNSNSNKREK